MAVADVTTNNTTAENEARVSELISKLSHRLVTRARKLASIGEGYSAEAMLGDAAHLIVGEQRDLDDAREMIEKLRESQGLPISQWNAERVSKRQESRERELLDLAERGELSTADLDEFWMMQDRHELALQNVNGHPVDDSPVSF